MKIILFIALVAGISAGVAPAFAQQVKKKVVADTVRQGRQASELTMDSPAVFLFPGFYSYWPVDKNDTIYRYECFNAGGSIITPDTLSNINAVAYILLIKTYTDYTRTYISPDGQPQPMPVSVKVYRYDRDGADKWLGKDYADNSYAHFQEYKEDIIKTENSTGVNPATGNKQLTIRRYYKVEAVNQ